jgi:hypothetical protein
MSRTVEVSEEVFAAIWSKWTAGDRTENDILKRILRGLATASISDSQDAASVSKVARVADVQASRQDLGSQRLIAAPRKIRLVDDVAEGLKLLGGEADLSEIYRMVHTIRSEHSRSIAPNFDAAIRQTLQSHASDSRYFQGREDLFRHVGHGRWKLRG